MSKKNIDDNDWNAWVADVRTFVSQDMDAVLSATQQMTEAKGEDFDADFFKEDWADIIENIEKGDKRASRRTDFKSNILNSGREMANWPKRQGGGISLPAYQVAVLNEGQVILNEAYTAFWNVLETNDATHLEMTRSSAKNGDGQEYGNLENFLKARISSRIAGLKGDIRNGTWADADDAKKFSLASKLLRPYTPKEEVAVEEAVVEEASE
jgi:hypothetical protein